MKGQRGITYTRDGRSLVRQLHQTLSNNPAARAKLVENSARVLRRVTGYPIDKCRAIMSLQSVAVKWDESQHPRVAAGSSTGGEFTDGADDSLSFNTKIDAMYRQQKVKDWEKAGYLDQLGMSRYFGNSTSMDLNGLLRKGADLGPGSPIWETDQLLQKAFKKQALTLPANTHVYRIIGGAAVSKFAKMKKGDSFTDKGYTSTGASNPLIYGSQRYSDVGNDKAILHITTKDPMKAIVYRDENELLFNKGRTFRVLSTQKHDTDTIINVEMT